MIAEARASATAAATLRLICSPSGSSRPAGRGPLPPRTPGSGCPSSACSAPLDDVGQERHQPLRRVLKRLHVLDAVLDDLGQLLRVVVHVEPHPDVRIDAALARDML